MITRPKQMVFPFSAKGLWFPCQVYFVARKFLFLCDGPNVFKCFAEVSTILQALCWARRHQQVCQFSSSSRLSRSFRFVCFFLITLRHMAGAFYPLHLFADCNGSTATHFFWVMTGPMSRPDEVGAPAFTIPRSFYFLCILTSSSSWERPD